jgi:hypothetical protein
MAQSPDGFTVAVDSPQSIPRNAYVGNSFLCTGTNCDSFMKAIYIITQKHAMRRGVLRFSQRVHYLLTFGVMGRQQEFLDDNNCQKTIKAV